MKILKLGIAILAIFGCASCATKNIDMNGLYSALSTGSQALSLTNDQLASYVKQSVDYMDQQNKVASDTSPYAKRLARLTNGLDAVGNIPLNFKVYETTEVNAFACADGSVRVYTGIMDMMDDEELLGIIGHEVGHVGLEHSKNMFQQQLINTALLQAIGSTSAQAAALTNSQLGELANAYVGAKFSRKQETEADDFGYDFLVGAGLNPYSMVEAFQKMQQLEGNSSAAASNTYFQKMFSSHPETAERIAHIQQRCKTDGYIK